MRNVQPDTNSSCHITSLQQDDITELVTVSVVVKKIWFKQYDLGSKYELVE